MRVKPSFLRISIAYVLTCGFNANAQASRILAQRVLEEIKAAHPEVTGLELAANKAGGCQTIAATEAKEIGEKCDQDEMTAWKTNRPFIESEKDEYDATVPMHDTTGKVISTVGMDFKREASRTRNTVEHEALKIVADFERRISSKEALFSPAP